MNRTKAVLFSALALLLLLTFALAACGEGEAGNGGSEYGTDGLEYTLMKDGTYTVSIGRAIFSKDIVIPPAYNGKPVVAIPDGAFADAENLESITLPKSIKTIGADAFKNCDGLEELHISDVSSWCETELASAYSNPLFYAKNLYLNGKLVDDLVIPEGTLYVNSYAFSHCESLESVVLPDSVTFIGESAFSLCPSLESITLGDGVRSIGKGAFTDSPNILYNDGASVYYLGNEENPYLALISVKNTGIATCTINGRTVTVADGAFESCSAMLSVSFSESIKHIGKRAFAGCDSIDRVYVSDIKTWCGIDFDGYYANPLYYADELYVGGEMLSSVTVPQDVTGIGSYAFYNYGGLREVALHDGVTLLGDYVFAYCEDLTDVTLGRGITRISDRAFDHCVSLDNIDFGENVTDIGSYAFSYCTGIRELVLDGGIEEIGSAAFLGCSELRTLVLGENVRRVGSEAFGACKRLTELSVSDGVSSLGERSFYDCLGLMSVTLPASVSYIGNDAFLGCYKLVEVINHTSLPISLGSPASGSVALYAKEIHKGESKIVKDIDGFYFFEKDGESFLLGIESPWTMLRLPTSFNGGSYVVSDYAFADTRGVTGVNISGGASYIGAFAFADCAELMSLTIGESVLEIGDFAFSECVSLMSVKLGDSVKIVGKSAFSHCTSLSDVTLGERTENVGAQAFYKCEELKSVSVGTGIKSFGAGAFEDCSSLESVTVTSLFAWCNAAFDGYYATPLFYADSLYLNGKRITSLTVPDGVVNISDYAFYGFDGILGITLPSSVRSVGTYAFYGCTRLAEVVNLTALDVAAAQTGNGYIAEHAIVVHKDASKITILDDFIFLDDGEAVYLIGYLGAAESVVLPSSYNGKNYVIYNRAFEESAMTDITVPAGVLGIGDYAFYGCKRLSKIDIPDSVEYIGSYAFASSVSLERVSIGNGVKTLGSWALKDCSALSSLELGAGLTSIGSSAFYACASLSDVVIPYNVDYIGNFAFAKCSSLASIEFERTDNWRYLEHFGQYDYVLNNIGVRLIGQSTITAPEVMANLLKNDYSEYFLQRIVSKTNTDSQA